MKVVKNNPNFKVKYERTKDQINIELVTTEKQKVTEEEFINSKLDNIQKEILKKYIIKNYMIYIDKDNKKLNGIKNKFKNAILSEKRVTDITEKELKNEQVFKELFYRKLPSGKIPKEVIKIHFGSENKNYKELAIDLHLEEKLKKIYSSLNRKKKYNSYQYYNDLIKERKIIDIINERKQILELINIKEIDKLIAKNTRYNRRELNLILNDYLLGINFFGSKIDRDSQEFRYQRYDIANELNKYYQKSLRKENHTRSDKNFQKYELHKLRVKINNYLMAIGNLHINGHATDNILTDEDLKIIKMRDTFNMKLYTSFVFAENALRNEISFIDTEFQHEEDLFFCDIDYSDKEKKLYIKKKHANRDTKKITELNELIIETNYLNKHLCKNIKNEVNQVKLFKELKDILKDKRNKIFHPGESEKSKNHNTEELNKLTNYLVTNHKEVYYQKFSSSNIDKILTKQAFEQFLKKLEISLKDDAINIMSFKKLEISKIYKECDYLTDKGIENHEDIRSIKNAIRAVLINLYDHAFKREKDLEQKLINEAYRQSNNNQNIKDLLPKDLTCLKSEINRLTLVANSEQNYQLEKQIKKFEQDVHSQCFINWLHNHKDIFKYQINEKQLTPNFEFNEIKDSITEFIIEGEIDYVYLAISIFNSIKQISELKEDMKKYRAMAKNENQTNNIQLLNLLLLYKKVILHPKEHTHTNEIRSSVEIFIPKINDLNQELGTKNYPNFYLQNKELVKKKEFELLYVLGQAKLEIGLEGCKELKVSSKDVESLETITKEKFMEYQKLKDNYFTDNCEKKEFKQLEKLERKIIKQEQVLNKLNLNNILDIGELYKELYSRLIAKMYQFERDCAYLIAGLMKDKICLERTIFEELNEDFSIFKGDETAKSLFLEIMGGEENFEKNIEIRNMICHFSLLGEKSDGFIKKRAVLKNNNEINFMSGECNIMKMIFDMFYYDRKKQTGLYSSIEEVFSSFKIMIEYNGLEIKRSENQLKIKRNMKEENYEIQLISDEKIDSTIKFFENLKVK